MNFSKRTLVAAFAVASLAGASTFAPTALAHKDQAMADSIAGKIASKFNLDQSEVKAAIEQFRAEQRAEFEAKFNAKLDAAVASGELTTEQKAMILTKREEVKSKREDIYNIEDPTERMEAMKQLHVDLKVWAQQNDIPLRWLGGAGIHAKAHSSLNLDRHKAY